MHNKVQKPLPKMVPPSLIFWIIAVICSGGSEATKGVWWDLIMRVAAKEGRKEGRKDRTATKHRGKRQTRNRANCCSPIHPKWTQ